MYSPLTDDVRAHRVRHDDGAVTYESRGPDLCLRLGPFRGALCPWCLCPYLCLGPAPARDPFRGRDRVLVDDDLLWTRHLQRYLALSL